MTDTTMDIDDLKLGWQRLDQRLERQNALAFQAFKDSRVRRARVRMWPLYGGQILQMLVGAVIIVAAADVWATHWQLVPVRLAGLTMHVYGVLLIVAATRTLWLLTRIDYAAPVVAIQRQLGDVRHWYARSGLAIGMSWWLLWMPFVMVMAALAGFDMFARAPGVFSLGTAIGLAGLLLNWGLYVASRRPRWAWIARLNDDAMTGASLRRAQAALDEVHRFEEDESGALLPPPD